MISFIVIGKNEGWKLTKCIQSILLFVNVNSIPFYEVVYVDSKSKDDSIERAKAFPEVKVFQITGDCNAAIGRNIGAIESKGEYLFFIDGDMEINTDFYYSVFNQDGNLRYDFVSGGLINNNYDSNWNFIFQSKYSRNTNFDKNETTTGGIFIIKRDLWNKVGGMNTKFMRNQDLDLGLRLSKFGFPILRKKEIIAYHHTIPYNDIKRTWKLLINGSELYPIVLFRDHIFNYRAWKIFAFENYTLLLLVFLFIFQFISFEPYFFISYFFLVFVKSFKINKKLDKITLINIPKLCLRDLIRFLGLFLFWPLKSDLLYVKL
jgi:glycosyltransferase involved in cell wall biosynthesis